MRDKGEGLTRTVHAANAIYEEVKQTNDATLDSRLMVNVSDLANKKTAQLVLGDSSTGIDVDEFLSKCITYMRNGGPLDRDDDDAPSTARRRRTRVRNDHDQDDDDVVGEQLDWEVLGRHACFPYNSRPCVPNFLLGPLSVEKKTRMQTQRRSRQSKDTAGREARPEALTREELSQSDENGLTAICTRIRKHLDGHLKKAEKVLKDAGFDTAEDLQSQRGKSMMRKCRISDTGGVSLFDYVVNPRSFGQTVENLFYVSFLIKEGSFGVEMDSQGLPTLCEYAFPTYIKILLIFQSRIRTDDYRRPAKEQDEQTPSCTVSGLQHLAEPHRGIRYPGADDPTPPGRSCDASRTARLVYVRVQRLRSYAHGLHLRNGSFDL